jgi:hypothetical protein
MPIYLFGEEAKKFFIKPPIGDLKCLNEADTRAKFIK